jgi:hypothetical protein
LWSQGQRTAPNIAAVHQAHESGVGLWLQDDAQLRLQLASPCTLEGLGTVQLQWWQSADTTIII